jgi:zinc transporter ZupT
MVIVLALSAFVSTLLGGLLALRNRDRLHLVLGFTAGVILGVVAFDVLPEMVDLARSTGTDAAAPIAGAASTLLFRLPDRGLLLYLGAFAGFLLYIGASDILPEAHAGHPSRVTLVMTILGAALIWILTRAIA